MVRRKTAVVRLTEDERIILRDWTRKGKSENRLVERARVILLADEGRTNQQIAQQLHTRTARVSKWRQRFATSRLAGLQDAARSGKPAKYDESTEKRVLKLLDEAPQKLVHQHGSGIRPQSRRCSGALSKSPRECPGLVGRRETIHSGAGARAGLSAPARRQGGKRLQSLL